MTHHTGSDEGLSEAEREALAMVVHEATLCGCDSGDGDRMVADELAPVVENILAARAAAPDALRERVEALADEWEGRCDAVAITYQDPEARRRATSAGRAFVADLRAALAERPTDGAPR